MSTFATVAFGIFAVMKIAAFGVAVRNALRPGPGKPIDLDGPDGSWRWWEEFGPQPGPRRPGGTESAPERELTRA